MYSPWEVVSTGGMNERGEIKAAWKCVECGRVVFKWGEPTAWAHNQDCPHSAHRDELQEGTEHGR